MNPGSLLAVEWSHDEVLDAVRARLGARPRTWSFEQANLDGDQVLISFRVAAEHFGVRYTLANVPVGPHTGERCDTPDEWAIEIMLAIDEQLDTGGLETAERTPGPDGRVLLRWRW